MIHYKNELILFFIENRLPFTSRRGTNSKHYGELGPPVSNIPFVSTGRMSVDNVFPAFESELSPVNSRISLSEFDNKGSDSCPLGRRSVDVVDSSFDSPRTSFSSNTVLFCHLLIFIFDIVLSVFVLTILYAQIEKFPTHSACYHHY